MSETGSEVETSMMETIEQNEELVKREKTKRKSCIDAMKNSLAALNEIIMEDLKNSEETASVSADAELGG